MKRFVLTLLFFCFLSDSGKTLSHGRPNPHEYLRAHHAYLQHVLQLIYFAPDLIEQFVMPVAERVLPYFLDSGFEPELAQYEAERAAEQFLRGRLNDLRR